MRWGEQVRTPRGPRGRRGLEKLAEMSAGNPAKGGGEAGKDPRREEDGVDQLAPPEGRLSWRDPGTLIYKRTLPLVEGMNTQTRGLQTRYHTID